MLNNLLAVLIFGSAILMGILLILNPLNVNRRANLLLGILNILLSTFWIEEILSMTNMGTTIFNIRTCLKPIQFLAPPVFYLSVKYFTNPEFKINFSNITLLLLPYIMLLAIEHYLNEKQLIIKVILLLLYNFYFIIFSTINLKRHKRYIREFSSNIAGINLRWLEFIIWFVMFLVAIVAVYNLTYFEAPLNVYMNIVVYIVVLLMSYYSLRQREIFPQDYKERNDALSVFIVDHKDNIHNKLISDEKLSELVIELNSIILDEELFLDSDLNLSKLAKKMKITPHQLSYLINNGFNLNFYSYINRFRVEKAKQLLVNRNLDKYSLIGIAFESGFNSKTSFNTMFKKFTGQTPSEYKKSNMSL